MHLIFRSIALFAALMVATTAWSQETPKQAAEPKATIEARTARRDLARIQMFKSILTLAREIAVARDGGADLAREVNEVIALLEPLPAQAFNAVERIRDALVFPDIKVAPAEFVVLDQKLLQDINNLDDIYNVIVDYFAVGRQYGMEVEPDVAILKEHLLDAAANRSVFLDVASREFGQMRRASGILPANSELAERLQATHARVDHRIHPS